MADLDEVQTLGETAIKTLTQLWRQLPRLDSQAGKKLGDEVAEARKAIERLVRIGCETHLNIPLGGVGSSSDNQTKLYEPLPFGHGHHRDRSIRSGPHTSPTRSDSSVSRVRGAPPKFPEPDPNNNNTSIVHNHHHHHQQQSNNNNMMIELDDELTGGSNDDGDNVVSKSQFDTTRAGRSVNHNNNNNTSDLVVSPSSQQHTSVNNISAARSGVNYSNNNNNHNNSATINTTTTPFLDEKAVAADYERFKRDLNLPAGLNYYDDPAWIEMMKSYQQHVSGGMLRLPLNKLTLMLQLAMRRELMWRMHSRKLQMQSDRDSLAEIETKGRCEIDIEATEHREELVAEMQGIRLSGEAENKRLKVFENIRKSFEREREMRDMFEKCDKMDEEKTKLAEEVSKLTKEVMKLAKDNTALTKKAASPSQALHPDQLKTIMEEITRLRQQVEDQEAELQALGV